MASVGASVADAIKKVRFRKARYALLKVADIDGQYLIETDKISERKVWSSLVVISSSFRR